MSEDGRRQQAKLREAAVIADRIGCSITQLAIGKEKKLFVITFPFIKGWYHKISKNRCNYFFSEFLRNKLQLNLSDISFKSSLGNQNITCPFHWQSLNWCCFVWIKKTLNKIKVCFFFTAWCLKNDNVNSVLLGASTVDQLYTNIQALQVWWCRQLIQWVNL